MIPNQVQLKKKIIEELESNPIIQVACTKLAIQRGTYYRWKQSDKKFSKKCNEARKISIPIINELAESTIMNKIKDGDLKSSIFWLINNHPKYRKNNLNSSFKINKLKDEIEKLKMERHAEIDRQTQMLRDLFDRARKSSTAINNTNEKNDMNDISN
ncbi:MAG: hypothetical protein PHZ07_02175 [Patescibacteria group bacterium]|nr:hypothetical protein [Patescibacteria group bacterium]MDD4304526.1 hypothetical protein [Patescibacteria group bacterium]MDD4694886.1 hypothetical protein [Patescibacteria group bacterium]